MLEKQEKAFIYSQGMERSSKVKKFSKCIERVRKLDLKDFNEEIQVSLDPMYGWIWSIEFGKC